MSPSEMQAQSMTPTTIVSIMPYPAPGPASASTSDPVVSITPTEVIIESRPATVTNKVKALARDVNDFINEHIGLFFVVFSILISLVLAVLFTKKGAALATAVKG